MTAGNGLVQLTTKDFKSDQEVRWCPGCGDYAILAGVQSFLPELGIPRENLVFVSGIGCAARFPYYVQTFGMHSIHGRAPAIATGLATSRPDLSVWVVTGDGDALSIGGNHLIHALRRNVDLTILLFNNRIYGLTKGQYSPTSERGKVTKSTPLGSVDQPFNPLSVAIGAEATFVARAIDTDKQGMAEVLRAAASHRGASFVEILQNCNIYNDGAFDVVRDQKENRLYLAPARRSAGARRAFACGPTGRSRSSTPPSAACSATIPGRDDPGLAFALARLTWETAGAVPLGVFRSVARPVYEELVHEQVQSERGAEGRGRPRAPSCTAPTPGRSADSGQRRSRSTRSSISAAVTRLASAGPRSPSARSARRVRRRRRRRTSSLPAAVGATSTPRPSPVSGRRVAKPVQLEHVDGARRRRVGRPERIGERAEAHGAEVDDRRRAPGTGTSRARPAPGRARSDAAAPARRGGRSTASATRRASEVATLTRFPPPARRAARRRVGVTNTAITAAHAAATADEQERADVGALGRYRRPGKRRRREDRRADLGADHRADGAHDRVDAGRDAGLGRIDGLGDEGRHGREGEADADAEPRHRDDDLPRLVVGRGEPKRRRGDQRHADRERPLRPEAAAEQPGERPGDRA